MRSIADEYLENRVLTASREQLHLMVVDAAILFARRAIQGLENRDFETSFNNFTSCRACVSELLSALNPEPNPELIDRLKALFLFVHERLVNADLYHDSQLARDALKILEMHRETWIEVMGRVQQERQPVQSAATNVTPARAIAVGEMPERSWVT